MTSPSMNITRKGQVTIPKAIRDKLNADAVYFEVEGDPILVKPVRDAAGSLREYAGNASRAGAMKAMRERAWQEAVREKAGKKSS
jgi:AbrB family looped-hinge helix DNA binding protein